MLRPPYRSVHPELVTWLTAQISCYYLIAPVAKPSQNREVSIIGGVWSIVPESDCAVSPWSRDSLYKNSRALVPRPAALASDHGPLYATSTRAYLKCNYLTPSLTRVCSGHKCKSRVCPGSSYGSQHSTLVSWERRSNTIPRSMPSPVDDNAGPRRKKKACRRCRHRKQRCDFEQPCHNCQAAGVGTASLRIINCVWLILARMYACRPRGISKSSRWICSGS